MKKHQNIIDVEDFEVFLKVGQKFT